MITTGGHLSAKHVIHAVGPVYEGGNKGEAELLASCHREAIRLADEHELKSVSFPAISTGVYGYPVREAAPIAISAVLKGLKSAHHVKKCRFVLFDIPTREKFEAAAEQLLDSDPGYPFQIEKA